MEELELKPTQPPTVVGLGLGLGLSLAIKEICKQGMELGLLLVMYVERNMHRNEGS